MIFGDTSMEAGFLNQTGILKFYKTWIKKCLKIKQIFSQSNLFFVFSLANHCWHLTTSMLKVIDFFLD